MMLYGGWYGGWYERRSAIDVKGGIRLQSTRGESASSWWGRRWNQMLYSHIDGGRLSRGRTYARRGQVISINIKKGKVSGMVQGSYSDPYVVKITMPPLSQDQWAKIADALRAKPAISARLMAGQMPEELEDVFKDSELQLFPEHSKTDCDCLDYANPCKHIAAIYLILSEQLDREPFLLLRLRGKEQKELLAMIGIKPLDMESDPAVSGLTPAAGPVDLPLEAGAFWGRSDSHAMQVGRVEIPTTSAALPRRLGSFPYWRSSELLTEALDPIYQDASKEGMDAFLGEDLAE